MKDVDLDLLTTQELFYLKDEWNEAYKKLAVEFDDLQKIHQALTREFNARNIKFDVDRNTEEPDDGDGDDFKHNNTIH